MRSLLSALLFVTGILTSLFGQSPQSSYTRTEYLIPMRDGIRLFTVVFTPAQAGAPLPFLLLRTPYGVGGQMPPDRMQSTQELAADGYIFVFQDIRGRYNSDGTFEMVRMSRDRRDPHSFDESTDAYDTIEWLLKHIPNNNGRAGIFGVSYAGWTAMMAAVDPHPALKAVSEQATIGDMFLGDDFHHNGAFRLGYAFEYAFMEESSKKDTLFPFSNYDTYDWFLRLGSLANVNVRFFHGSLPSWNNFVAHPNYDEFWQRQGIASRIDTPRVPILHVAGWWDQEDFYGPITTYRLLEQNDRQRINHVVIGPWNHGGWSRSDGRSLGRISFDTSTALTFRQEIQRPWFAYHLKRQGESNTPEAVTFQTGTNRWRVYDAWPPSNLAPQRLYFHENGFLSFEPPTQRHLANDSFVSDPSRPVPYRPRPIEQTYGSGSRWRTWLVEDQRFVHLRPDVLSWETSPLTEDVTLTGDVTAMLYASTTGTDCDWIIKLIDVYPAEFPRDPSLGGYQLMVANEVFRGRYRKSFEKPEPLTPNAIDEFRIDMRQMDHVFQKGHKIMVQVQSTWFPLIDRNPQTYVPNIFEASDEDFRAQTHRVYRSMQYPSHIEVGRRGNR